MTTVHPRSRTWTAAAVGLVFGVFVAGGGTQPLWAGQEEQFTPEYQGIAHTPLTPNIRRKSPRRTRSSGDNGLTSPSTSGLVGNILP